MSIRWSLKLYLASKHQIYTVTALQKRIFQKTGVVISVANLCNYVNRNPRMIRLETIEILCTALGCELKDMLEVGPSDRVRKPEKRRKLSFKNTPKSKIGQSGFPAPTDYESTV